MKKNPPRFKVDPVPMPVVYTTVQLEELRKKELMIKRKDETAETDEERWAREYDEENDPDPWGDLDSCSAQDEGWDQVEDWEMLGLDPDTPQDEIDQAWENQM